MGPKTFRCRGHPRSDLHMSGVWPRLELFSMQGESLGPTESRADFWYIRATPCS